MAKKVKTPSTKTMASEPSGRTVRNRRRRARQRSALYTMSSLGGLLPVEPPNTTTLGEKPNPADPRTVSGTLLQLGQTANGRIDAFNILHPCAEGTLGESTSIKVPDGAIDSSVSYQRRDEYHLTHPTDLPAADTWDLLVYHTPFLKRSRWACRWPVALGPSADVIQSAFMSALVAAESSALHYPTWTPVVAEAGMAWTWLNSTQLTPGLWAPVAGEDPSKPEPIIRGVRRVLYGATSDLDAPALSDQGRYVGGQFQLSVTLDEAAFVPTPPTITAIAPAYAVESPPSTTDQMVASDLRVRQAEAKPGTYMPLRLSDPSIPFTASVEYRAFLPKAYDADTEPNAGLFAKDLWLRSWMVGVDYWQGLSQTAGIRLKVREILELTTSPSSILSPMNNPGHPSDDRSFSIIREFARTEPHSYPASYNEGDGFWSKLVRGIGSVVGSLGIPVLSGVANPLADLLASHI